MRAGVLAGMVLGLGLAIAGAGRDPQPIDMVQSQDANSDYAMMTAEIQVNNMRADSQNRPQKIAFLYRHEQSRHLARESCRVQRPEPFW